MVVQTTLSARPVGFVVAGGLSTRMGRDKALLPWQGSTLIDHAIARLAAVCGDVRILCGPAPRYANLGRPLVVDAMPDELLTPPGSIPRPVQRRPGPLAALAAGLESAGDLAGLYLGVDLPLVSIELLSTLAEPAGDADAVVPVTARGPEPLCALYGPRCLAAVRARLSAGDLTMTSFWPEVRVRTLEGPALAAFGDPRRIFHNVNAPADYLLLAGDTKAQV